MNFRIKSSIFSALGLLSILLVACNGDPAQRLNDEIMNADRIEMRMRVGEDLVDGIKFAYSTVEEKNQLSAGLLELKSADSKCLEEMGRLVFLKEEKVSSELVFNASGNCSYAWFESGMSDRAFSLSDSLANLIQTRFELVSSVKRPTD